MDAQAQLDFDGRFNLSGIRSTGLCTREKNKNQPHFTIPFFLKSPLLYLYCNLTVMAWLFD